MLETKWTPTLKSLRYTACLTYAQMN